MDSSVATRAVLATESPIVSDALPPVPTPSTRRPGASSWSVAMALAVTEMWRVCGTVMPGPRRMREVAAAQAVSVTQSSRQTRWVSVIHAVSKPRDSASWTWRTMTGSGWLARMPMSNFMGAAENRPKAPARQEVC